MLITIPKPYVFFTIDIEMASQSPKITLYVDTVSPFAYEAYWLLRNDPVFAQCEITYIPMFLGGVMKATGNVAPINIKSVCSLSDLSWRGILDLASNGVEVRVLMMWFTHR